MYKIWIGSHTSLCWFLRGSSILSELQFVGFCRRRKTGEFGKEGSEYGYANPLVRAFFAKCASVKILSKSETTNTSANPLDLPLKSSIRELYKAKSVDPKTYSPTSKNLHITYDSPPAGIGSGPHWWEASSLTTVSSLLPKSNHEMVSVVICRH